MHDYETSAWADRHQDFTGFAFGLIAQMRVAFERLNAQMYDAPWKDQGAARSAPKRAA